MPWINNEDIYASSRDARFQDPEASRSLLFGQGAPFWRQVRTVARDAMPGGRALYESMNRPFGDDDPREGIDDQVDPNYRVDAEHPMVQRFPELFMGVRNQHQFDRTVRERERADQYAREASETGLLAQALGSVARPDVAASMLLMPGGLGFWRSALLEGAATIATESAYAAEEGRFREGAGANALFSFVVGGAMGRFGMAPYDAADEILYTGRAHARAAENLETRAPMEIAPEVEELMGNLPQGMRQHIDANAEELPEGALGALPGGANRADVLKARRIYRNPWQGGAPMTGDNTPAWAKAPFGFLPDTALKRTLQRGSIFAQAAAERLVENAFYTNRNVFNFEGNTTVVGRARLWASNFYKPARRMDELYDEYRAEKTANGLQYDSNQAFRENVTRAIRDLEDPTALRNYDPRVVKAAEAWSTEFYGKFGKVIDDEGIFAQPIATKLKDREAKLKSAQINPTATAKEIADLTNQIADLKAALKHAKRPVSRKNYVNRMYNRDAIMRNRRGFVSLLMAKGGMSMDVAESVTDRVLRLGTRFMPSNVDDVGSAMSLKERMLDMIPDKDLEPFLENDITNLTRFYLQNTSVDLEMIREFGSIDMHNVMDAVAGEYDALIAQHGGNAKALGMLTREKDAALKDLRAMRDIVRGTYGMTADPHSLVSRAIRTGKQLNVMSMLTGGLSQLPDLARIVMREGFSETLEFGLKPLVKDLQDLLGGRGGQSALGMGKRQAQEVGEAIETYLNIRYAALTGAEDNFLGTSKFEKLVQRGSDAFHAISLSSQATDFAKSVTSMIAGSRMLRDIDKWAGVTEDGLNVEVLNILARATGGKPSIDDAVKARLAWAGLKDQAMAARIAKEFKQHGVRKERLRFANTERWTDREAAETFNHMLSKELNTTIVTPQPGDAPNWTYSQLGGVISQFKSYNFAAMQRVMGVGMQEMDAKFYMGMAGMVGLGAMVQTIRDWQLDSPKRSWKDFMDAAINRSGILGYIMDVQSIQDALMTGQAGRAVELSGGPMMSRAFDLFSVADDALSGRLDSGTTATVVNMLPLSRVFYLDGLFDILRNPGSTDAPRPAMNQKSEASRS